MSTRIRIVSPFGQIAITTAYIFAWAVVFYALGLVGTGTETIGTLAVIATAIGLWFAVCNVGVFSWAIGSALAWLAVVLVFIFQFA